MTTPGEDPQQAVARARAHVLGGRGLGAPRAETDRYKRERPMLGPLPAPLERELVHLQTATIRGHDGEVDVTDLDTQRRRLRQVWAGEAPQHPRRVAMDSALGGAIDPRSPDASRRPGPRLLWLAVAAVLGSRRRHRTGP